ncbi:MAG TPA: TIGR00730 family Rossman fold protein [Bacteroidales bacterium]|nr:TIGR00730 family Rossman fold protein [Bacteroidales bacterium]
MRVCVFAASSSRIDRRFADAASDLGRLLANAGIGVIYGGGGIGLMGILADAVLANGGAVTGIIPAFMDDEGWGHSTLKDMIITPDMGERKRKMFSLADAVVALPGGPGTLEELTEAITLKQLGLFKGPVIILNTLGFYDPLIELFDRMIKGNFLRQEHKGMWIVVSTPEEVAVVLAKRSKWIDDPRRIARI